MQRGHPARQPLAKAGEELRGESDLGNEHERLATAGDRRLDEPQVDLGLAAAGDAVEDEGAELPEARLHRFHGAALLGVEDRAMGVSGRIRRIEPVGRGCGVPGRGQPDAAGPRSPLDAAGRIDHPQAAGQPGAAGRPWSARCGGSE